MRKSAGKDQQKGNKMRQQSGLKEDQREVYRAGKVEEKKGQRDSQADNKFSTNSLQTQQAQYKLSTNSKGPVQTQCQFNTNSVQTQKAQYKLSTNSIQTQKAQYKLNTNSTVEFVLSLC